MCRNLSNQVERSTNRSVDRSRRKQLLEVRDSSCAGARTWCLDEPWPVGKGCARWVAGEMVARKTCGFEVLAMTGVACAGS